MFSLQTTVFRCSGNFPQRQGSQKKCAGEVLAGPNRGGEKISKPCSRSVSGSQGCSDDSTYSRGAYRSLFILQKIVDEAIEI